MKLTAVVAVAVAATVLAVPPSLAQGDRWTLRGRAVAVLPDDDSDTVGGTGTSIAVDGSFGAELALTYRFRPSLSLELGAAFVPLDLATEGGQAPDLEVGSIDLMSAALTLQYRFQTTGRVDPYLGIGMVFGRISGYSITPDMQGVGLADITFSDIVRLFTQFGVDVEIGRGWMLNADVRYAPMTTQMNLITTAGTSLDKIALQINPVMLSLGLARSF